MPRAKRFLSLAALLAFPLLCHIAVARGNASAAALGMALPVAVNLALCALFGRTLAFGREPMIARFARLVRSAQLAPDLARYARALTILWTAFFAAMASISVGLAIWGSTLTWSLFTNLVNYLLVALLFIGEYVYRRFRFKQYQHLSLIEIVRRLQLYRPS